MKHPQNTSIALGKIAIFFLRGKLHFAFITQEHEAKITLCDNYGEEIILSASRIILLSNDQVINSAEELQSFIHEVESRINSFKLPPLQGQTFSQICDLLMLDNDVQRFALYLHLKHNPEAYYQKHEHFFSRNAAEQESFRQAREAAALRKDYLNAVESFIRDQNEAALTPDVATELITDLRKILQGERVEDMENLLSRISSKAEIPSLASQIRHRLHDASEDPIFAATGLPYAFTGLPEPLCVRATHLPFSGVQAFCIDDEDTLDYDDAISFESGVNSYSLGIHVSNLASFLNPEHPLFHAALERVSSLYLPPEIIPMLPLKYSQQEFSLCADSQRIVLSLMLELSAEFRILKSELKIQKIAIEHNLSYASVDKDKQDPRFSKLLQIADFLRNQRDPGREKERYYYGLKAQGDAASIKRIDNLSPARMMVEEMMILYNRSIAEYAIKNKLPLLYRNINQFLDEHQEVRSSSAFLATSPGYHPGIGAEAYLHATSPIRRVVDIINQMQICEYLENGRLLFENEALSAMIPGIEKRILQIRDTVQRSERYWFLKYIEQNHLHKPLQARLKGFVNGRIKADILPWGKQVLLDCPAESRDEYFHIVVYQIDWDRRILKADLID